MLNTDKEKKPGPDEALSPKRLSPLSYLLVLIWQHDVNALAVESQVDWRVAQLQGSATAQHLCWAHNQAGTCRRQAE